MKTKQNARYGDMVFFSCGQYFAVMHDYFQTKDFVKISLRKNLDEIGCVIVNKKERIIDFLYVSDRKNFSILKKLAKRLAKKLGYEYSKEFLEKK